VKIFFFKPFEYYLATVEKFSFLLKKNKNVFKVRMRIPLYFKTLLTRCEAADTLVVLEASSPEIGAPMVKVTQ
jgi:hypothetical protein